MHSGKMPLVSPICRRTFLASAAGACLRAASWSCREMRRFPAPEANQAVAVDAAHFYAIGNHEIAKYEKFSGRRVARWACEREKPLIHLNSGVVREGVLYCAHSNYPGVPMVSSIEMWATRTLTHTATQSFGIYEGSATWIDFRGASRFVTFGHYGNKAGVAGRDPQWTSLAEFDSEWRRLRGWVYPARLMEKLGGYTISGGAFGPDGRLYCTGHDDPEVYVLRLPEGGSVLELEAVFATPNHGQGIAWDPSEKWVLYSIDRVRREVIVSRVEAA